MHLTLDRVGGTVSAGLAAPAEGGDHLVGCVDTALGRAWIERRTAGEVTRLGEVAVDPPEAGHRLGFGLCENRATVLLDRGHGWRAVTTARPAPARHPDLRDPDVLAGYRYAWGAAGGEAVLSQVRAGLFGMTGLRDLHLVQHADGTPYLRDGLLHLTATCAGLGFFRQAHWGVFTLDPARPDRLEQVAQLFTRRDGRVLGDHAGQLVRHEDRWIVLTSSWGDFMPGGIHVRHTETDADLLRGVHFLDTERTDLPTAQTSWDPGLTRVEGRWYLSFVQSPSQQPFDFHPALAVAEGPDWREGLTMVGAPDRLHACEGPVIARHGGAWRLLASDGDARRYPAFDLAMRPAGEVDAPYGSNIPHPQLVPLPDGSGELMVTFDGTAYDEAVLGYGGHGDVLVLRAVPAGPGRVPRLLGRRLRRGVRRTARSGRGAGRAVRRWTGRATERLVGRPVGRLRHATRR